MATMNMMRRLRQLNMVFTSNNKRPAPLAMQPFSTLTSAQDHQHVLSVTFSDIDANLLTSEAKCNNFIDFYKNLPKDNRERFLCDLVTEYGFDKNIVKDHARNLSTAAQKSENNLYSSADRMRSALRPKFKTLFVHIGRVDGGVKFLVDLRADILGMRQKSSNETDVTLYQELNSALRDLLLMWFTVGFLNLERITWNSPCDLVQKVSNYEAVHRIKTWEDIKRRVGPYRRCYIFTHNSMPREPVVVLHTALMPNIASSIHSIIYNSRYQTTPQEFPDFYTMQNPTTPVTPTSPNTPEPAASVSISSGSTTENLKEDPSQIAAAVFYSITSTQKGLQGIDMGNYLIKTVVKRIQEEFPHLSQFSSLSPIPGFRDWLLAKVNHNLNTRNAGEQLDIPVLLPHEMEALKPFMTEQHASVLDFFKEQLNDYMWTKDSNLALVMRDPLMRLCANYLYLQKRRNYALNPVANFHLSNGAQLWRINFLADTSQRGLTQSLSLMVNYRYFLESTMENSRNYLEKHQISVADQVLDLLKPEGNR